MSLVWIVVSFIIFVLYPYIFINNSKVRYYSKVALHNVNFTVASLLTIPFALVRPKDVRNYNIFAFFMRIMAKVFDITWTINGKEHLSGEDAVVIVCNHQSSLDIVGIMRLWPMMKRTAPVAKRELLFRSGPFGWMAYLSGTVFVDRFNSVKARETLDDSLVYLTKKKTKLWIFPEGTRHKENTLLPFKKGAFHMALQAQVPIVPVVISSYSSFYDSSKKIFENGGNVTIQILPPVQTKGLTAAKDLNSLIAAVRDPMVETFNALSGIKPEDTSKTEST